jgi:hypothetical protein
VVLAEEAGVEPHGLGELRFGDDLVDGALEVLATRGIGDGGVEANFMGHLHARHQDRLRPTRFRSSPVATGSGAERKAD